MGKESQFYGGGGGGVKCSKHNSVTLFFLVNPCILENNFTLQTFQKLFNVFLYFPSSSKRKYSYACVCVCTCVLSAHLLWKRLKNIFECPVRSPLFRIFACLLLGPGMFFICLFSCLFVSNWMWPAPGSKKQCRMCLNIVWLLNSEN